MASSLENEDGKLYISRHTHMLFFNEGLASYTCSGCKQRGGNKGYKCRSCVNFILHAACATIPDEYGHPYFNQQRLKFCKNTKLRHHCDGCGEVLRGFLFESNKAHLKLHPLCMELPPALTYSGHTIHGDLRLEIENYRDYSCSHCNEVNNKWKYRCPATACKVKVDLNCAIVNFHNLSQRGISRVSPISRAEKVLNRISGAGKYTVDMVASGAASALEEATATALVKEVTAENEEEDGGGENEEEDEGGDKEEEDEGGDNKEEE